MSTTLEQALIALNNATNDVAGAIATLRAQLALGQPVTPGQLQQMDSIIARLEGLAADPANPVPAT